MAQCDGDRVCGIRRRQAFREPEQRLDHGTNLVLASSTPARNRVLDFVRRVFDNVAANAGGFSHSQTASHTNAHGRRHVGLEEHSLHCHNIRLQLSDQVPKLSLELGQTNRPIEAWVGPDNTRSDGTWFAAVLHTAVAASGKPGIDT